MDSIERYPYLWATLIILAGVVAAATTLRGSRRLAIFSGLLHAPTGLLGFAFVEYWSPHRLMGSSVGIEDFLFNFTAGLAAWLFVAPLPHARSLQIRWDFAAIMPRTAVFGTAGLSAFLAMWMWGIDAMTALLVDLALCGSYILARRWWLWPLAVPAALALPILHGSATTTAFALWPGFPADWNAGHIWGVPLVLDLPLGELAWAAAFGATWPLVVAFLLDAQPAVASAKTARSVAMQRG